MSQVKLEEITVKKIIIHILDTSMSIPVLSKEEMPTAIGINEYFATQIAKIINNDSTRKCVFADDRNTFIDTLKEYKTNKTDFITFTNQLAGALFAVMSANINIPSGDLAIVKFRCKQKDYIALLKLNYKDSYIHITDYEQELNRNILVQQRTTLPGANQMVNEAAIIDLEDMKVDVLEKVYEIDGEKKRYLSGMFLKCDTKLSSKEKLKSVEVATNRVIKKFFDTDINVKMGIIETLYNNLNEDGEIDIDNYVEEAFPEREEAKEIFFGTLEKCGIEENKVALEEKTIERAFRTKKIKTDEGIEVKIPMDFYNNSSKMELVTEANGRITLVLKDINKIL